MSNKILLKCLPPYLAVWVGLFLFHNAWAALIGLHLAFLLVLTVSKSNFSPESLIKSNHIKWILLNIGLCSLSGFGIYFLRPFIGLSTNFKTQLAEIGLTSHSLPTFIAYFTLVNPLIEEYFWRTFLGSDSKKFYTGDLFYAGYHALVLIHYVSLPIVLFSVACLTFIGWFWRQVKREDQGQLAAVLGHMAADLSILMAVYWITI